MNHDCVYTFSDQIIDSINADLKELSLFLWNNPEIGLLEVLAHEKLTTFLDKQGYQVTRHYPTPTAFLATWPLLQKPDEYQHVPKTTKGIHAGFMCEYDALPGIGHACGHNLIAISSIGAGCAVQSVLQKFTTDEDSRISTLNDCRVSVFGTPAEENVGGKIDHINAGTVLDLNFALMAHPSDFNNLTPRSLACTDILATFSGVSSHASLKPWEGVNALDAAVLAYQSLSCFRQQFEPGWQAHAIFTKGGDAANVIPNEAQLTCMLRTTKKKGLTKLEARIKDCFEGAAKATGCKLKFEAGYSYDDIIQNKTLTRIYKEQCENHDGLIVENNRGDAEIESSQLNKLISAPIINNVPQGSTDMGNISYITPSIHPKFAIGCSRSVHTIEFTQCTNTQLAHWAAIRQAKVLARTCLQLMLNPTLMHEAKRHFKEDTQ